MEDCLGGRSPGAAAVEGTWAEARQSGESAGTGGPGPMRSHLDDLPEGSGLRLLKALKRLSAARCGTNAACHRFANEACAYGVAGLLEMRPRD